MTVKIKQIVLNVVLIAITVVAAITLGSRAPSWYAQWRGAGIDGDFAAHVAGQPQKLTLYGTTTCVYCKRARAWLEVNRIAYNDVLIDQSTAASQQYGTLGIEGVPVLVAEKQYVLGFTEHSYEQFLESNLPSLMKYSGEKQ